MMMSRRRKIYEDADYDHDDFDHHEYDHDDYDDDYDCDDEKSSNGLLDDGQYFM
jgi:hypothetical protein